MKNSPKQGCIYHVVNVRNGKGYVGQHKTPNVEVRWKAHLRLANKGVKTPFYHALRKYGSEGFTWEIVWKCAPTDLCKKESYYIKKLHTFIDDPLGRGYNLTLGGESPNHCKASKKKLKKSMTRRWQNPEYRAEMTLQNKLLGSDPKIKKLRSVSRKNFWASLTPNERKEVVKRIKKGQKSRTPEQLAAQRLLSSEGARKQWRDPAFRELWRRKMKAYQENLTKEDKASKYAAVGKKSKRMWASRSKEEKQLISAKILKTYNNKSQKEKEAICEKKRLGALRRYATTTPEERKAEWRRTHPNGNRPNSTK